MRVILAVLFFLMFSYTQSQCIVKGSIANIEDNGAVEFAQLILKDGDVSTGIIANEKGHFELELPQSGNFQLTINHLSFQTYIHPTLLECDKRKTIPIHIKMLKNIVDVSEVTITTKKTSIDEFNTVSTYELDPKAISQLPGIGNDPALLVTTLPGVSAPTKVGSNEVSVRGNTPRGNLWRIEELVVPSPNHFSQEGGSGGSISMLSSFLLENSNFSTGAFSAEYGNALGGVFDMHLRKGDKARKYWFAISPINLDVGMEGPVKERFNYVASYRISSFSLIKKTGFEIRGIDNPEYQDLNYNLIWRTKNLKGKINIFGVNGLSSINFIKKGKDIDGNKINISDELNNYDMGINGLGFEYNFSDRVKLKTSTAYIFSNAQADRTVYDDSLGFVNSNVENYQNRYLTNHTYTYFEPKKSVSFKVGGIFTHLNFEASRATYNFSKDNTRSRAQGDGNTWYGQFYASNRWEVNDKIATTAGLHFFYFGFNKKYAIEPRLGAIYTPHQEHEISYSFGMHSKMENMLTYLSYYNQKTETYPNQDLDFTRALHNIVAYKWRPKPLLEFGLSGYYQYLYGVPISDDNVFSSINKSTTINKNKLNNSGKGWNYGGEISLNYVSDKKVTIITNFSLFDSKFVAADGQARSSQQANIYTSNFILSKEYSLKKNSNIQLGIRAVVAGGRRYTPIDIEESLRSGDKEVDKDALFSERAPTFYRIDGRFSYNRNYKKTAHSLNLDIQNMTHRLNVIGVDYDPIIGVTLKEEGQILPILSYRIIFTQ